MSRLAPVCGALSVGLLSVSAAAGTSRTELDVTAACRISVDSQPLSTFSPVRLSARGDSSKVFQVFTREGAIYLLSLVHRGQVRKKGINGEHVGDSYFLVLSRLLDESALPLAAKSLSPLLPPRVNGRHTGGILLNGKTIAGQRR